MTRTRSRRIAILLDEIIGNADGDEAQLRALHRAIEAQVAVPCPAKVAGEMVKATYFDFDGNLRRGLAATILRVDGSVHVVSAADVVLADASRQLYLDAYRHWIELAAPKPSARPTASMPRTMDVAVWSVSARAAECKLLRRGGGGDHATGSRAIGSRTGRDHNRQTHQTAELCRPPASIRPHHGYATGPAGPRIDSIAITPLRRLGPRRRILG